jgi:hypothetical protein
MTKCSEQITQLILKNFEEKSASEYFKVVHYLFKKQYDLDTEEGVRRYRIFQDNLKIIKEHNAKQQSYKLGVNEFAEMTNEEFTKNTWWIQN